MESFYAPDAFTRARSEKKALLVYFSNEQCSLCKALKPKVTEMVQLEFPLLSAHTVDIETSPELAAREIIFTVPVALVYFEGRECIRLIRNFGTHELREKIERHYTAFFNSYGLNSAVR
jgi:thioredoxin 1